MSHHFRCYSEHAGTLHGQQQHQHQHSQQQQQQQQHQHPLQLQSNPVNITDGSANGIIRIHSDSQQSLDRLFNPPTNETSVPLRQRNLPSSFFNPTKQQEVPRKTTSLHMRSTSYEPRHQALITASTGGGGGSNVNNSNGNNNNGGLSAYSSHGSLTQATQPQPQPQAQPQTQPQQQVHYIPQPSPQNNNHHQPQQQNSLHYRNYSSPAYVHNDNSRFGTQYIANESGGGIDHQHQLTSLVELTDPYSSSNSNYAQETQQPPPIIQQQLVVHQPVKQPEAPRRATSLHVRSTSYGPGHRSGIGESIPTLTSGLMSTGGSSCSMRSNSTSGLVSDLAPSNGCSAASLQQVQYLAECQDNHQPPQHTSLHYRNYSSPAYVYNNDNNNHFDAQYVPYGSGDNFNYSGEPQQQQLQQPPPYL